MLGLIGRKIGMTRIFDNGKVIPATILHVDRNFVTQIKTQDTDGYNAVQVTCGSKKISRLSKAEKGHFAKANVEPGLGLWEFKLNNEEVALGQEITMQLFSIGQKVDVRSLSRGKGFAGVVKRHNFKSQRASHGNSLSHNAPGSIGQRQSPGKVFKGKRMAGQLGNVLCTVQSQKIVAIDEARKLLLVQGGVPGAPKGFVVIKPAIKSKK